MARNERLRQEKLNEQNNTAKSKREGSPANSSIDVLEDSSAHDIASLLNDTRLQPIQRQALVAQIGQLSGNHNLQRMLLQLDGDAPAKEAETVKHYSLKDADIVLSAKVEAKVQEIANSYYKKANKDIVVTSGNRTPAEQASAMYTKLSEGDDLSEYKNKTAKEEISKAYNDAVKEKKTKDATIAAMTTVIQGQVDKGTYISTHLVAGAVDIRKKDMSEDEQAKFEQASKAAGITPLAEGIPPHYHLEVK